MQLDKRNKMSPIQFAIILLVTGLGAGTAGAPAQVVPVAGQHGWISLIIGGVFFTGLAYIIIKLTEYYPDKTLGEFLPLITGRMAASIIILVYALIFLIQMALRIQIFAREITYFMFDRTPFEAVILVFLVICTYGAVQSWGTIASVLYIIAFTFTPLLLFILLLSFINFNYINMQPQWPVNWSGVLQASLKTWGLFFGYEVITVLSPVLYRGNTSIIKTVSLSIVTKTAIAILAVITSIGTLTVKGVEQTLFPILISVRSIELPGTFIERIDDYFLMVWIPLAWSTIVVHVYGISTVLKDLYGYKDHRHFVIMLIAFLFLASASLHDFEFFKMVLDLNNYAGLAATTILFPALLFLAWRKRRSV